MPDEATQGVANRRLHAIPVRGRGRWAARSLASGMLVAGCLAVAGCGSPRPITILDTEKVERAIEQSVFAQRGKHVHVDCPSGVHQARGLAFSCLAVSRGASTRFVVTELDGSGQVRYEAR